MWRTGKLWISSESRIGKYASVQKLWQKQNWLWNSGHSLYIWALFRTQIDHCKGSTSHGSSEVIFILMMMTGREWLKDEMHYKQWPAIWSIQLKLQLILVCYRCTLFCIQSRIVFVWGRVQLHCFYLIIFRLHFQLHSSCIEHQKKNVVT